MPEVRRALVVLAMAQQFTSTQALSQNPMSFQAMQPGMSASMQRRLQIQQEMHAGDEYMAEVWKKHKDDLMPWKAAPQDADKEHRNICIAGKQVPDFYVLGVQKCATTSLAENLMAAGMSRVHGDLNPKEFHWFDHRMDYELLGQAGGEGFHANREEWLSWMPDCPAKTGHGRIERTALADFTPDYFRIVPRPIEFIAAGHDWMKVQEADIMGPEKFIQMYGAENAKKLQFGLMFREPLAQMQSAWYHAQSFNFTNACKSCRASSFKEALRTNLAGLAKKPAEINPWLWTTMYARQMAPWLKHFNASQFYIVPMHQISGDNKDNVCRDISKRLNFNANCDSAGVEMGTSWSHEHPSVEDDAGDMREAFDQFMDDENEDLVQLLAKAHMDGMGLSNYDGPQGSVKYIRNWLLTTW